MKNDITHIKQLLEKFYDAETSEQDEILLKEYFEGDVAPEFEVYKPQFEFYKFGYDDNKPLSQNFDEKFLNKIAGSGLKQVENRSYKTYWYASVAAAILVIFGVFQFINTSDKATDKDYAYAVESLILISDNFEIASSQLESLGDFDPNFDHFDAFKALETYGKHFIKQ